VETAISISEFQGVCSFNAAGTGADVRLGGEHPLFRAARASQVAAFAGEIAMWE
jgi:hypothetical protein